MSVIGDPGDDVTGVADVGPARFLGMFDELIQYTGTIDEIYERVRKNKLIFDPIPTSIKNKYLRKVVDEEVNNKTVSNNLRLVSFELICRELEDPSSTEILEKRKLIENILNTEDKVSCNALKKALDKHQVYLEESSLDFLYL
jgi:5'-3' exonuclease